MCSPSNHLHVDQVSLFRAPHWHRQTLVFKAFFLPATPKLMLPEVTTEVAPRGLVQFPCDLLKADRPLNEQLPSRRGSP